jgi:hypothetical protein
MATPGITLTPQEEDALDAFTLTHSAVQKSSVLACLRGHDAAFVKKDGTCWGIGVDANGDPTPPPGMTNRGVGRFFFEL